MPSLTLAAGGTFAQLVGEHFGPPTGGGLRGVVSGFSRESRKRLMDLLNQIRCDDLSTGLFVTLTYPDAFPPEAETWKRDLDTFCKRAKRQYPKSVWVWRLEWKTRLSGQNAGKMAPHFHLLALGVPWLDLRWLASAWFETVNSGDDRHLGAGTQAQRIRSRRGVLYYAAKYMSKEAASPEFWTGRVWGVVGRELLPVFLVTFVLSWGDFYKVRRVLRGWLERKRGRKAWARLRGQGMTAYLGDGDVKRVLTWAAA